MAKPDRRLTALARIIKAAGERYVVQGAVKGNLQVPDLTEAERVELSTLFGSYVKTRPGETLKLALKDLEKALQDQAVSVDLLTAIALVTERPVETKAARTAAEEQRWAAFLESVSSLGLGGQSGDWAEALVSGDSCAASVIRREYQAGETGLLQDIAFVMTALDNLPLHSHRTTRLPVFAREVTGNPHGFDESQRAGRLLIRALTDQLGVACGVAQPPQSAVERGVLLTAAGLLPDGISSTVTVFGLKGARRKDGRPDLQVDGAARDATAVVAPLRQVTEWQELITPNKAIFAVENPAVFEELVDTVHPGVGLPPLLCTSGFLSVAAIRLLDLAVDQRLVLYYGGDFDVKGLTIAAGLLRRYGERVRLWGMSANDYRIAAEHEQAEVLLDCELARLDEFSDTPLADVAAEMKRYRKRAYQEALIPILARSYRVFQ